MAVPKKKSSKMRTRHRKAAWKVRPAHSFPAARSVRLPGCPTGRVGSAVAIEDVK